MAHRSTDTVQNERTKKMEHTKLMPRHLLLLLLPIASALVGGMLFSGNSSAFFRSVGGRGISQAQLFLGLALLSGALALGIKYLLQVFRAAIIIFMPLLYALAVMPQLGPKQALRSLCIKSGNYPGALGDITLYLFQIPGTTLAHCSFRFSGSIGVDSLFQSFVSGFRHAFS
jgi:hypothetical protein